VSIRRTKCRSGSTTARNSAWLIDADLRTVYIYRPGRSPEKCVGLNAISGEGSVEGFTLQLADIWEGL
jgi:hypothetical protein